MARLPCEAGAGAGDLAGDRVATGPAATVAVAASAGGHTQRQGQGEGIAISHLFKSRFPPVWISFEGGSNELQSIDGDFARCYFLVKVVKKR